MLAVVQDKQRVPVAEGLLERGEERVPGPLLHAEDPRHRARHQAAIIERRQLYKPRPVWIGTRPILRHRRRQARLTRSSRTREREQARPGE